MLRVQILGSGGSAGVPMIGGADGHGDWGACDPREARNRRTRASILLRGADGRRLLVDTSPDMRAQLLACGIPRIDAVMWTHPHADHILGLDDIRILNRINDAPMDAFASAATMDELRRRFDYVFRPHNGQGWFRPVLNVTEIAPGAVVEMAGLDVRLIAQDHGYSETLGLRVGDFAYSTDFVALGAEALAALEGLDTWMVDCFQRQPHRTHSWFDHTLELIARLKPRRAILTHMGPDLDWAWMSRRVPPGVEPGYDGMTIELGGTRDR